MHKEHLIGEEFVGGWRRDNKDNRQNEGEKRYDNAVQENTNGDSGETEQTRVGFMLFQK